MKSRKIFRILVLILVLVLLAVVSLAVVKKAHSMYKNLYTESEKLQSVLSNLGMRMEKLEKTVGTHVTRYDFDYSWVDQVPPLAAHAMGKVGEDSLTNSLDAFEHNYALGYRVFEVDFDVTDDNVLVATHSENTWREQTGADENTPFTLENFNRLPLLGKYQSLDTSEIVGLLQKHPDVYLITDTKHTDRVNVMLQFSQLVRCAMEVDPSILDRIVPQIYSEEMLDWVMSVHPFRSVIFTLYNTTWTPESVVRFCEATGVGMITTWYTYMEQPLSDLWAEHDLRIGIHTVNNNPVANDCFAMGADIIYSDKLLPADFSMNK